MPKWVLIFNFFQNYFSRSVLFLFKIDVGYIFKKFQNRFGDVDFRATGIQTFCKILYFEFRASQNGHRYFKIKFCNITLLPNTIWEKVHYTVFVYNFKWRRISKPSMYLFEVQWSTLLKVPCAFPHIVQRRTRLQH